MYKIGIIGAGHISIKHFDAFKNNPECEIVAVADLNLDLAKKRAEEYNIKNAYADYKEILNDKEIDAVSIVTPTFTHKNIVVEALQAGKDVLCEKPPALNADEVRECEEIAKKTGKLLMFAMVCRFRSQTQYLKRYIAQGKMGKIVSGECSRVFRCHGFEGWFTSRKRGGGVLIDNVIHELDNILYLMDYPKPKAVIASQTFVNADLPSRLQSEGAVWTSEDKNKYETDVESAISGYVTFEDGTGIYVKAAGTLNSVKTGCLLDISGEKAGARFEGGADDLKILELTDDNYFVESTPCLKQPDMYQAEVDHFVDCLNGAECMIKTSEAVILMEIIDAMYKSADTGLPVIL